MKRILEILIVGLVLAGCGGADPTEVVEATSTHTPTVDIQMLETVAQGTMSALMTSAAPGPSQTPTDTPIPPTATGTATPIPDTPTITLTPTPTITLTPTPVFTVTKSVGDPEDGLGDVTYLERFRDGENWYLYEDDDAKVEVGLGVMTYTIFETLSGATWTLSGLGAKNFNVEVYATAPGACFSKDSYGLVYRAEDPSHAYVLMISCDGHFQLGMIEGTKYSVLEYWHLSDAINTGPGQRNIFGVLVSGNEHRIYINGTYVWRIINDTYLGSGVFGLAINSDVTENFVVEFDNLAYWVLP